MNPGGKLFEARSPLTVNFSILHQKSDSKCLILLGCEIHQLFLTAFALWSLNHLLYVWLMPWICTLVPWAFFWNQEWLINLNSFRFFCSQVAGLRSEIVSQLLTFIIIDSWSHLKSAYSTFTHSSVCPCRICNRARLETWAGLGPGADPRLALGEAGFTNWLRFMTGTRAKPLFVLGCCSCCRTRVEFTSVHGQFFGPSRLYPIFLGSFLRGSLPVGVWAWAFLWS